MDVDWTQLPPELVETIAKRQKIYADYIRLRSVCRTWRYSTIKYPDHLPPQLPWLMFPQRQPNPSRRALYNLSSGKFHFLNLPEASHNKRLCGSSHGWLTILDDSPTIVLVNPITREKVYLPPVSTFPNVIAFSYSNVGREYVTVRGLIDRERPETVSLRHMRDWFIKKLVLSSSPKRNRFATMAILHSSELAYCKQGDQSWTILETVLGYSEDVVYFNGLFYAVNKFGQTVVCDVSGDSPTVSFLVMTPQLGGDLQYLVGSGQELLLVTRYIDVEMDLDDVAEIPEHLGYKTRRFEVFRLNWRESEWERVRNLGDSMLFIGQNCSLSLQASDFSGCLGDRIYYTDDYSENSCYGERDMGIFKLEDESLETLPSSSRSLDSRPLWVSPNPS
ncbi:hypothetical protein K2173_027785 [Erythroxylum novogranatense]|uniref:KIB1-4 beta-propeller domain-containing protein n=1 Tax=Erythroxylum novogranatense TaxID=1862640 RepID=A0AAV8U3Y0_9ROSI|nr:hypothetical protein K2173_027785 [Erythroxylum novogranatense]